MTTPSPNESRAEKRVLWEVRERYNLPSQSRRASSVPHAKPPAPPIKPPVSKRHLKGGGGPRRKKHWGLRIFMTLLLIVILSGGVFGYKILAASNKISTAEQSILGQLKDLLFKSGQTLKGEKTDRINVLLMAVGGEGHSGENLADTIMMVSIRPSDHAVALLSIPRDLYVKVPGESYYSKINAVHAYGEAKKKDGGPELLIQEVKEITGQDVDYYARVDFTAFKNLVDSVGGVDITIPKTFVDYWHKITFPEGTEKMNGERALAYARARYVEGSEGGDFKRAARQQQLLLAIRDKVFSVNTAFDFTRVNSVLNSLSNNIRTNMQLWEMKRFFELARQINHDQIHSVVLSNGSNGVLVGGTEILGGTPAYVLKTRTGDFSEIQKIATNLLNDPTEKTLVSTPQDDSTAQTPPPEGTNPLATGLPSTPTPVPVKPTIEIRNGTNTTGLAKKTQEELVAKGYEVMSIGNAADRATAKTTVYAISDKFVDSSKEVATLVHSSQTDSGLPKKETATKADVLIILGADADR